MTDNNWRKESLCAQVDPELFFPLVVSGQEAKKICKKCPVRLQCLDFALGMQTTERFYGIWGGLDPDELRTLKRRRDYAAGR